MYDTHKWMLNVAKIVELSVLDPTTNETLKLNKNCNVKLIVLSEMSQNVCLYEGFWFVFTNSIIIFHVYNEIGFIMHI